LYYFLFALYMVLGAFLVTRMPFVKKTGLSAGIIIALFLLKIFAGVAIGWMTQKYYPGNDYWMLNREGFTEYNIMLNDPREFFTNIFRSPYNNGYSGFFNSIGSYWNDLRNNIILKLLAICNIFSHGNYYINSLFFNFFSFLGSVALFRVFAAIYENKKWPVLLGCFLLPSALYFSSGIHKDLVVFTMLSLFCYALYFSVVQKPGYQRIILLILSFSFIFLIRNYVAIALLPACFAFVFSVKKKANPYLIFLSTYVSIFLVLLLLELFVPSFQPLKVITQKQSDFMALPVAASQVNMNILEPRLGSVAANIPNAFCNGFLRPYLWDAKSTHFLLFSIELLVYELLLLIFIFRQRKRKSAIHPFVLMSLLFSISMLFITGLIIPNLGSIVRYKSIYLPYLITPLLCSIGQGKSK
jgi:hypothetical protein